MDTPLVIDKGVTICPPLTAIQADWMKDLLENRDKLRSLIDQYGSPINIHSTVPFVENYKEYVSTLQTHRLDHKIFYARKANKCLAFVKAAHENGFCVDTASYNELKQCLDLGMDGSRLVLTAAIKTEQLIRLAIENGVLIILDNVDEIEVVSKIARELETAAPIGIRVSGFEVNGEKLYSRFGFDIDETKTVVFNHIKSNSSLIFQGFHFHLNGYSIEQRAVALAAVAELSDVFAAHGMDTKFIDIGGGLLMNYLQSGEQWQYFIDTLKSAVSGEADPVTFQNNGLGFQMIDGELKGELATYPYYNESPRDRFLDKVLSYTVGGQAVAKMLADRGIALHLEPGRSLLDQTGITLAEVIYRKRDSQGNLLVGLNMNRTQLCSSSADYLLDPVYLPAENNMANNDPVGVYFVGAYCLEQDLILKRKIAIPHYPQVGDLVCFLNTAGYMMHFYETEAHQFNLSTNLILHADDAISLDDVHKV